MTNSRRRRTIVLGGLIVAIAAAVGGYLYLFGGDAPEEAALSSPSPTVPGSGGPTASEGDFDGTWTVDTESGSLGEGTSTYAGYRIEEELSGFGANAAVGRTKGVDATLTIDGTEVPALDVTVDMTSLASDDDRRDGQLVERGLQTGAFPTATFVLTEPMDLGSVPATGEVIDATATGDLTLHGVTREVQVPVQAQWTGERIEVVGSADVVLTDYDIEAPVGFIVMSVADTGTIEMHLLFQPA